MSSAGDEQVRFDRWLWAARFYKSRSRAAAAITGGKARVNGRRVKRSTGIRVGDRVSVRKGPYEHRIIVQELAERRGPASEARTLYEETEESIKDRERTRLQQKASPKFDFREKGKPSKKERRELRRWKRRGWRE